MLIIGLVVGGDRGPLLIGIGLGLAGSAASSSRSASTSPASARTRLCSPGIPAIAVLALLFYAGPDSLPPLARVGIAAAVFAASLFGLATMFRRKAGVRSSCAEGRVRDLP